jgi:hypothetical protein
MTIGSDGGGVIIRCKHLGPSVVFPSFALSP